MDVVNDIRSRFTGIEVLYDQLYLSTDQGSSSVHAYINGLVPRVTGLFPHASEVEVSLNVSEFSLDAKRLSALGLIVNELVTNAMKYAFQRNNGTARLSVHCTNDSGRIVLTVTDNGIGMPATIRTAISKMGSGPSIDLSSFGITIVSSLTQQLDGTIEFQHDGGTSVTVAFPP